MSSSRIAELTKPQTTGYGHTCAGQISLFCRYLFLSWKECVHTRIHQRFESLWLYPRLLLLWTLHSYRAVPYRVGVLGIPIHDPLALREVYLQQEDLVRDLYYWRILPDAEASRVPLSGSSAIWSNRRLIKSRMWGAKPKMQLEACLRIVLIMNGMERILCNMQLVVLF